MAPIRNKPTRPKKTLYRTIRVMVLSREALKPERYQSVWRGVKPNADELPILPDGEQRRR
jgi:hypothetical protein